MRELRGAGLVAVKHVATESNPADLFTKVLSRQVFEQHRRTVLNAAGGDAVERLHRARLAVAGRVPSERESKAINKLEALLVG